MTKKTPPADAREVADLHDTAGQLRPAVDEFVELLNSRSWSQDAMGRTYRLASDRGNREIAAELIEAGLDPNLRLTSGDDPPTPTRLVLGYRRAHLPLLRALIENGADLEARGMDGMTLLHLLAGQGDIDRFEPRNGNSYSREEHRVFRELVRQVVEAGADLEARNAFRETPLHVALANRPKTQMPELLLDLGATCDGGALSKACASGRLDRVERMIEGGADVDATDAAGNAPLHRAVRAEREAAGIVGRLLAAGARPDASNTRGDTPLGIAIAVGANRAASLLSEHVTPGPAELVEAVRAGDVELVQDLLEAGVSVNGRAARDVAPLHVAISTGAEQIEQRLLDAGASYDVFDHHGRSPLHYVVRAGEVETARRLLDAGVPVDHRQPGRRTPFVDAAGNLDLEMMKLLEERGADVDVVADDTTPLLRAAQAVYGQHDPGRVRAVFQFLLGKGADVQFADSQGQTPLHMIVYALQSGPDPCAEAAAGLLLEYGADPDAAPGATVSPRQFAADHGLEHALAALNREV